MIKCLSAIVSLWLLVMPVWGYAGESVWEPYTSIRRHGSTLEMLKHKMVVAESGLPEQVLIRPHALSLPLEMRDKDIAPETQALTAFGRGPMLRLPMRIEASVEGNRAEAVVTQPAAVAEESAGAITFASALKAGPVDVRLETVYMCDGALHAKIAWTSDAAFDELALIIYMEGPVTHAYRGLPADFRPDAFTADQLDTMISDEHDAVVWSSLDEWAGSRRNFVDYLYFGSLDRGFTWLCGGGVIIDDETPMVSIVRDAAGNAALRINFVNRMVERSQGEVSFVLAVNPSRPRAVGFRNVQWLNWPAEEQNLPAGSPVEVRAKLLDAGARENLQELSGFTASAFESAGTRLELRGFAGANSISPAQDNVRLYPASLFAMLVGPHLGLPARIRTNTAQIVPAGARQSYDRQIIGRALTYDIGAALEGFRQPVQFLRTVSILDQFGLFDDEETEVIPYWRNSGIIRYGEVWDSEDAFELEQKNPAEHVYVTVFRRRHEQDGRKGYKALIVVLNEGESAVSQRLHILDSNRLFGGLNAQTPQELFEILPFNVIPEEGDWRFEKVYRDHTSRHFGRSVGRHTDDWQRGQGPPPVLRDMEDNGYVTRFPMRENPPPDMYGPLFVGARDIRILYGYALEE